MLCGTNTVSVHFDRDTEIPELLVEFSRLLPRFSTEKRAEFPRLYKLFEALEQTGADVDSLRFVLSTIEKEYR